MEAKYITYIPKVLSLKERKIKQNPSCETTIQLANELNSYGTSSSLIDAAQEAWNTSLGGVVVLHHLWTGWRVRSWVYNWMSAVVTYWLKKKSTKYKTIKPLNLKSKSKLLQLKHLHYQSIHIYKPYSYYTYKYTYAVNNIKQ